MNIFNIGGSGIRAANVLLSVTALNIQNAATPGYSRQRAELIAQAALNGGRLNTGDGVEVSGIRRMADQFLIKQVWSGNTDANYYHQTQKYLGQLEGMIGSESSGLGAGLDDFFGAISGASEKPLEKAGRDNVLNQAQALATRFNNLQKFVQKQRAEAQQQQQTTVASINTLVGNLADYNKKITETEATGGDTSILRDQRDQLVQELSTYADIRVNEGQGGSYAISLASGEPLLQGSKAGTLAIGGTPTSMTVEFAGTKMQAKMSCGGQLGSLHDYMTTTLTDMEESVVGMAKTLSEEFNNVLGGGFDANGDPGGPLFKFDPNDPTGMLHVLITDSDKLAFSGDKDSPGNNDNLKKLLAVKTTNYNIPGLGNTSLDSGAATLISRVGIKSRQNQADLDAAGALLEKSMTARDNFSAVDFDEEAVNLMSYTKFYQSNMKVIATGDQLFGELLGLF